MTPERQQKIDELHKRSNRVLEIAVGSLMLLGKSIREAHEKAVAVSAFVCTQRGAMPILPEELKA